MESARELWNRWRRGRDDESFARLVEPHVGFALDVARRHGCRPGEAEDVVQETLASLARERGDDPVRVGLRPWLARRIRFAARKRARSFLRRRRHEASSARDPVVRDVTAARPAGP